MQNFHIPKLLAKQNELGKPWQEYLRCPSMSIGLYHLKAGDLDGQTPHTEDEAYYVVAGKGHLQVGSVRREVEAGDLFFVERGQDHRFFDVREDLTLLVIFAPAEYSMKGAGK